MDIQAISLDPLIGKTIGILGYGNQGRAQALNLKQSGMDVRVGAALGTKGRRQAEVDGFAPESLEECALQADIAVLLLPDEVIGPVHEDLAGSLAGKSVGFSHGFAYHFGTFEKLDSCEYFLVNPKGAGFMLRRAVEQGESLPGVFSVPKGSKPETRTIAMAYAKAIGCGEVYLHETSFAEETECDLFGEQAVLCGGIMELMSAGFETLVNNGHSEEMAFFECCFEAKLILDLWMAHGPAGLSEKISPTAFYGGLTRGRRLINEQTRREMQKVFEEIRSGDFAKEWLAEVKAGKKSLKQAHQAQLKSRLEATFQRLSFSK